jgi:hypothetical protein
MLRLLGDLSEAMGFGTEPWAEAMAVFFARIEAEREERLRGIREINASLPFADPIAEHAPLVIMDEASSLDDLDAMMLKVRNRVGFTVLRSDGGLITLIPGSGS